MAKKTQIESYTFSYDFSTSLGDATIASIVSVTRTGQDTALANEAQNISGKAVLVRWGGGTVGVTYSTEAVILSSNGDTFVVTGNIFVGPITAYTGYGSISGFRHYHSERGRDVTGYDDGQIAGALLIATEWIDGTFRDHFQGLKVAPATQEREWPRTDVVDYYGYAVSSLTVPVQLERATYEAAYREVQSANALNTDARPKPYTQVRIEGAIAVSYGNQDAEALRLQIPIIEQILSSLMYRYGTGRMSSLSGPTVRA